MLYYYSITHEHMGSYKAFIFSGIVAPPPPIGNISVSFPPLSFYSPYVSTVMTYSIILDGGLPAPKRRPGVWRWWITDLFSSTVLSMLYLYSVLCCFSGIVTGDESGSPSDALVSSLALWEHHLQI